MCHYESYHLLYRQTWMSQGSPVPWRPTLGPTTGSHCSLICPHDLCSGKSSSSWCLKACATALWALPRENSLLRISQNLPIFRHYHPQTKVATMALMSWSTFRYLPMGAMHPYLIYRFLWSLLSWIGMSHGDNSFVLLYHLELVIHLK